METRKIKVLLIEDNALFASAIMEILAAESSPRFDTTRTERLSTALELLTEGEMDLVLVDLTLPDSSGLDTVIQVC